MTSYAYRVTLSETEVITLEEALRIYSALSKAEGPAKFKPMRGNSNAAEAILRRLYADAQMMSTSSFCWPKRF